MIIMPSDRQKKLFERKYWRLFRKVFVRVRQSVVDKAEHIDGDRLKGYVRQSLDEKLMKYHIDELWSEVGGKVGYDISRKIKQAKSSTPEMEYKADNTQIELWKARMRAYSAERSMQKVQKILDSETEAINKVINSVLEDSAAAGKGILETRRSMVNALEGEELATIENWQAQRIALTEVGAAQNTSTWMEGEGEGLLKQWLHLPVSKVPRSNHIEYGMMGPQEEDYEYTTGLKYPHDEDADAEEVINCYCDIYWVTKD